MGVSGWKQPPKKLYDPQFFGEYCRSRQTHSKLAKETPPNLCYNTSAVADQLMHAMSLPEAVIGSIRHCIRGFDFPGNNPDNTA